MYLVVHHIPSVVPHVSHCLHTGNQLPINYVWWSQQLYKRSDCGSNIVTMVPVGVWARQVYEFPYSVQYLSAVVL